MTRYAFFEEADDTVELSLESIASETDVSLLTDAFRQWDAERDKIAERLAVSRDAGHPDPDWAQRAISAVIFKRRGCRAVQTRLLELGVQVFTREQKEKWDSFAAKMAERDAAKEAARERTEAAAKRGATDGEIKALRNTIAMLQQHCAAQERRIEAQSAHIGQINDAGAAEKRRAREERQARLERKFVDVAKARLDSSVFEMIMLAAQEMLA